MAMAAMYSITISIMSAVWAEDQCEVPVWNLGDRWTYKDATGRTWDQEVVDVKEDLYIVKSGETKSPLLEAYDKKSLNLTFNIDPQSGQKSNSENAVRKLLNFPMSVGKKWQDLISSIPGGQSNVMKTNYGSDFKIEGVEEIVTSAGKFKAYRIYYYQENMSSALRPSGWIRYWYSPGAKTWIKRTMERSQYWAKSPRKDAELVSFNLK